MKKRLIINGMLAQKLLSGASFFFMTMASALMILVTLLTSQLFGTIDHLMEQAKVPDIVQMHEGYVDVNSLSSFVQQSPVTHWQILTFLNLDNGTLTLSGHSLTESTQDNGLAVQSNQFDFLLDMDGKRPDVKPGQVYVPVAYKNKYSVKPGDTFSVGKDNFVVAGFVRDAQMNAMMASSKRFLVSRKDYEKLKPSGQEEYLIEFMLENGADVSEFSSAYERAGLPANGPAVSRSLIRLMNALSDGMMILVLFLVSMAILAVSLICVHFMVDLRLERDRREIGVQKALGIDEKDIRRVYFARYLIFAGAGLMAGCLLAWVVHFPLGAQLHELYGGAQADLVSFMWGLMAGMGVEAIILYSIWRTLSRACGRRCLEALRNEKGKNRIWLRQVLIGAVSCVCLFLMVVPVNLYETLSDSSFVTYMGIGSGEFRLDVRQDGADSIYSVMQSDERVMRLVLLKTVSAQAMLKDGRSVRLNVESGDHGVFPVRYAKGHEPQAMDEIALSVLSGQDLDLRLGDDLLLDGKLYRVCGFYSDITNGGKTAKVRGEFLGMPILWNVLYASLEPGTDEDVWMADYRQMGADVVQIQSYVQDTYGQTLLVLGRTSLAVAAIGLLVLMAVLTLFAQLLVEQERNALSLRKALGFNDRDCARLCFWQAMVPVLMGEGAGLFLGCSGGQVLCGGVLASYGAAGFAFVYDWGMLGLMFGVSILCAVISIWAGVFRVKDIKPYECCLGRE